MTVTLDELTHGELEVVGQLVDASNGSLLCRLADGEASPWSSTSRGSGSDRSGTSPTAP